MNYKWKDTKRNHESEPWRERDENDKADPTLKHELWRGTSTLNEGEYLASFSRRFYPW